MVITAAVDIITIILTIEIFLTIIDIITTKVKIITFKFMINFTYIIIVVGAIIASSIVVVIEASSFTIYTSVDVTTSFDFVAFTTFKDSYCNPTSFVNHRWE